MSRLTWKQHDFVENYSKDPNQAAVLLDSLTHRNISDFRYALEVMKCDPNLLDASTGLSVFQTVLQTPKSSELIQLCINSGANFYKVNKSSLINYSNRMMFWFHRKAPVIATRFITQSNHYVQRMSKSFWKTTIHRKWMSSLVGRTAYTCWSVHWTARTLVMLVSV